VQEAPTSLERLDGVAAVQRPLQRSKDGMLALFVRRLRADDTYIAGALARVDTMRDRLDDLGPGAEALVGRGQRGAVGLQPGGRSVT
jgi:hypothetical protein